VGEAALAHSRLRQSASNFEGSRQEWLKRLIAIPTRPPRVDRISSTAQNMMARRRTERRLVGLPRRSIKFGSYAIRTPGRNEAQ
jgi:hypothetical protein